LLLALLHAAAVRGRLLLIHVDGPDRGSALIEVATAHPGWKVIVAHAGPGTPCREADLAATTVAARDVFAW